MKEKISIIVSVYNTEKYIATCLDSLLHQTYSNLEIILIDDGSSDNSLNILKEYQKKDSRILLLINDSNQGLAYSRNLGVQKVHGNYLSFIDSDDYVDLDFYEKLMNSILANGSDIAVCNIKSIYENTGTVLLHPGCNGKAEDCFSYIHTGLAASACNKLIARDLLKDNFFPIGKVNEDLPVIISCLVKAKKISYQPEVNYYYIQRDSSIQNSHFSNRKFDIFEMLSLTLENIKGCEQYEKIYHSLVFHQVIFLLFYEFIKIPSFGKRIPFLKKYAELSKDYHLLSNPFLPEFFKKTGKKTGIFYQIFLKMVVHRHFWVASFMISFYQFYKKHFETITLSHPSLKELETLARQNSKLKQEYPKISVVIPNYNYASFLYQRVESILKQKVRIYEIIFLDDYSTDNSVAVINRIIKCISPYVSVQKKYNQKNSGSAFSQWEKGFSCARGDYVWICEADDYCSKKILTKLIKPIRKKQNIVISYCDTAMMDTEGNLLVSSLKPEIDLLKTGHWNRSYVSNGTEEMKRYAFLNCTIANVSSALIKKGDYQAFFALSKKYKQAGDWLFYLNVMNLGNVAFYHKVCNYYRIHGSNVTSVTKKKEHLKEIQAVHQYIRTHFSLSSFQEEKINERYEYLKKVWDLKGE